ncbi:hypothetical protein TNCV_2190921 [Trichonephila clavipes]|uniref:Uncharacterized protein n=1 Tax=Trichonephila clavipes TaxID=2585209 RepID=A0A8X6R9R0_TRICX|nr:hypothetical protein TNCV_2190921 [Trichonephila clavipes]
MLPLTIKHTSDQEYDLVKEYESDDERHVALQSLIDHWTNTPPRRNHTTTSTTRCSRLRREGTQIFHSPLSPPIPLSKHHCNMFETGTSRIPTCSIG